MKSLRTRTHSKLPIIIAAAAVLIAIGGYAALATQRHYWPFPASPTATADPQTTTAPVVSQSDIDQQKTDFAQQQQTEEDAKNSTNTNSSASSSTASVIITDAAQYDDGIEVRAYIPDHYEDGTCTTTLTNGSLTVSKTTTAYRDAKTTICTNPLIQRSEFTKAGDWTVTVAYSSNGASGTSAPQTVTIK